MSAALEPLALSPREAAAFLSISKRSLSRLIGAGKIEARKAGPRTLVDVASLKAYYESLPKKTDHCRSCSAAALMWCCGREARSVIDDLKGGLDNDHRKSLRRARA